jgi:hypothetical protein
MEKSIIGKKNKINTNNRKNKSAMRQCNILYNIIAYIRKKRAVE